MPVSSVWSYSSSFGTRDGNLHSGLDFRGSEGANIYAAHRGTVRVVRSRANYDARRAEHRAAGIDTQESDNRLSRGVYMTVTSLDGRVVTRYAHLDSIIVESGNVGGGQRIATMGNTGRSTGPHLHFDVIIDGISRNPWEFLP